MGGDVVTGGGGSKRKMPNWRTVALVIGALLLAVAAGAGVRMLVDRNEQKDQPATPATEGTPSTASGLPEEADSIQNLQINGNTEEANKQINEGLNSSSTSPDERYRLYILQGNGFFNANNFTEAAKSYEQAAAVKEIYEAVNLLAMTYEALGQKDKAIARYEQAISIMPKTPVSNETKKILEQKVQALKGQP